MQQPELGLKITELRKQKGFTQEELVERCNINVRTLQRIENGEVTPRSYTIKTILSALDHHLEDLQKNAKEASNSLQYMSINEAKSVNKLLTIAWVAGIVFLIVAVFEGVGDYFRMEEGELVFGTYGHIIIKILVLVLNILLLYGFLISGKVLKNYLMKISTVLMIIALICFYLYDIISVFADSWSFEAVIFAESVTFGALGILFGISIIKSRTILGTIGTASGVGELLMAGCLLTVVLSPVALFLFFPVILLEILVLYKISGLVKENV